MVRGRVRGRVRLRVRGRIRVRVRVREGAAHLGDAEGHAARVLLEAELEVEEDAWEIQGRYRGDTGEM